jgi:hypothetical protein
LNSRLNPLDLTGEEVNGFLYWRSCMGQLFLILEQSGHRVLGQLEIREGS